MITVDRGNGIEMADETLLEKREGLFEDDNERTSWVEYWEAGKLVHRSAHVHIKKGLSIDAVTGLIGG